MTDVFEKLYCEGCYFLPVQKDKSPAIINGVQLGVTHATRDKSIINQWINDGYGLGVAGGTLERPETLFLVVDDIDIKREDGNASLANLEALYGKLPPTFEMLTPSQGRHLYYFSTGRIGSCVDAFKVKFGQPGIDIKGHHGYVVAVQEGYTIKEERPIAILPPEWALFLQATIEERSRQTTETFSIPPEVEVVTEFNKRTNIHQALLGAGYKRVGERTYQHPFDATSLANVTILENRNFLKNGSEFVSYHFGAHDRIQKGPHDPFDIIRLLQFDGDWSAALAFVKEKLNLNKDTIQYGGNLYKIMEDCKFRNERLELVEKHIRQKDIVLLSGQSENYKTFWCLALAFSGATGLPFLGKFKVRPFKTALVLTESEDDYLDRVEAWIKYNAEEFKMKPEELRDKINENCFVYFNPLVLDHDESKQMFERFKKKWNPDFKPNVWVIDHFSNNTKCDENDNNSVAQFLSAVRTKAREENSVIVIPHHPSKGGQLLRGASVLFNNVPVVYEFKRDEGKDGTKQNVTVSQKKCSYYNGFESYDLKTHVFELRWDESFVIPQQRTGLTLSVYNTVNSFIPTEDEVIFPNDKRKPSSETQSRVLEYLDHLKNNEPLRKRVDVDTIARVTSLTHPQISVALNVLEEQKKVKRTGVKGKNKYLWESITPVKKDIDPIILE